VIRLVAWQRGLSAFQGFLRGDRLLTALVDKQPDPFTGDVAEASMLLLCESLEFRSLGGRYAQANLIRQSLHTHLLSDAMIACHASSLASTTAPVDEQKNTNRALTAVAEFVIGYELGHDRWLGVYFEHDGPDRKYSYSDALRTGRYDDISAALASPVELLCFRAATTVGEWEIGRYIERVNGAWWVRPKVHVWRRSGDRVWREHGSTSGRRGDGPTRRQRDAATIEPYLRLIGDLIDEVLRTLPACALPLEARTGVLRTEASAKFPPVPMSHPSLPEFADLMAPWSLGLPRSARGAKRGFDSADLSRISGESNDSNVAARLYVHPRTPGQRRSRDQKRELG
jgi:hypothetical protein